MTNKTFLYSSIWHSVLLKSPIKYKNKILVSCVAAASVVSQPVLAQAQHTSLQLEEIVVTAQRRDENLQDVPVAVAAFSGDDLVGKGVDGTEALSEVVPGLVVYNQQGRFLPRLRGVGNSLISAGYESGISTYVDGVYYASTTIGVMSLNNIERVEVLKGPQGTLFGRNATGGLVQVVTKKPDHEFGGNIALTYANYDTVTADGYVTGGHSENLAMDLAFHYSEQGDGWGTNLFDGKDVYKIDEDTALRSSLIFTPSDRTELRLAADYNKNENSMSANQPREDQGFVPDANANGINDHDEGIIDQITDDYDVSLNLAPKGEIEGWGVSMHFVHEFDFATLTSITAYRESDFLFQQDVETTKIHTIDLYINQSDEQFTQELQLSSNADSFATWVVGAYWFDGESSHDPFGVDYNVPVPPLDTRAINADLTTESYAFYGQSTIPVTDKTNLTLGIRYTSEDRDIKASDIAIHLLGFPVDLSPPPEDKSYSKTTYRIALDHQITDNVMGYISWNTGFKSGGFNGTTPNTAANAPFAPELLTAWEVGLKTSLLDGRLRLNTAAFFYDYEDVQLGRFVQGNTIFYNGPDAEVTGIDVDFEALLTERLVITGGLSWLDTEFQSHDYLGTQPVIFHTPSATGGNTLTLGDAEGNELPFAPEYTVSLGAQYTIPLENGELVFNGQYSYNDGFFWGPDNTYYEPSYSFVNASAVWALDNGMEFTLWGRNLADEEATQATFYSAVATVSQKFPPRTYGVTLKYSF